MTIIYINLHPSYDYAMAIISGFVELRQYVTENNDSICWVPGGRGSNRQLMIKRNKPHNIAKFIEFVQREGCVVKIRNGRNDEWRDFDESFAEKETL